MIPNPDRHITGNYAEDSFVGEDEWPDDEEIEPDQPDTISPGLRDLIRLRRRYVEFIQAVKLA